MKLLTLIAALTTLSLSAVTFAEANNNRGDDFRLTAYEYELKAKHATNNGDNSAARILSRLAAIKREAANLADAGKWSEIDWTEYHQLNQQLSK